jgi:hypothetical protein
MLPQAFAPMSPRLRGGGRPRPGRPWDAQFAGHACVWMCWSSVQGRHPTARAPYPRAVYRRLRRPCAGQERGPGSWRRSEWTMQPSREERRTMTRVAEQQYRLTQAHLHSLAIARRVQFIGMRAAQGRCLFACRRSQALAKAANWDVVRQGQKRNLIGKVRFGLAVEAEKPRQVPGLRFASAKDSIPLYLATRVVTPSEVTRTASPTRN